MPVGFSGVLIMVSLQTGEPGYVSLEGMSCPRGTHLSVLWSLPAPFTEGLFPCKVAHEWWGGSTPLSLTIQRIYRGFFGPKMLPMSLYLFSFVHTQFYAANACFESNTPFLDQQVTSEVGRAQPSYAELKQIFGFFLVQSSRKLLEGRGAIAVLKVVFRGSCGFSSKFN